MRGRATRVRAALIHLLLSALIGAIASVLVFGLWYPWPYNQVAGGQRLFFLLVSVDIALGPLLTLVVFARDKPRRTLLIDLTVIALLQVGALAYGLHTVFIARPIALVFEVDRFRVVSATDVDSSELAAAMPEYRSLPLTGPWLLGTRSSASGQEQLVAIQRGLQGVDIAPRPMYWQPYAASAQAAVRRSRPVPLLLQQYADKRDEIEATLRGLDLDAREARFLPLQGRRSWVVFLNGSGQVKGFGPYDGSF